MRFGGQASLHKLDRHWTQTWCKCCWISYHLWSIQTSQQLPAFQATASSRLVCLGHRQSETSVQNKWVRTCRVCLDLLARHSHWHVWKTHWSLGKEYPRASLGHRLWNVDQEQSELRSGSWWAKIWNCRHTVQWLTLGIFQCWDSSSLDFVQYQQSLWMYRECSWKGALASSSHQITGYSNVWQQIDACQEDHRILIAQRTQLS